MPEPENSLVDLFAEFDLACEFLSAIGAFAELRRYVSAVHQFLPHTFAQQAVRVEAQLKREADPVRTGELEYELEVVGQDAVVTLPRVVWGGVLISIFAAYENGVRNALRHWQSTTGHAEVFRNLPRKDFLKSAEAYANAHVGVALFQSGHLRETLSALKSFRNSFAHGSGLVTDLPAALGAAVIAKLHPGVTLEVVDGQWVANARSAAYYLLSAERASKQFENAVLEKCLEYHRGRAKEA